MSTSAAVKMVTSDCSRADTRLLIVTKQHSTSGVTSWVDHGGYWILRNTTGVYTEEVELLLVPDDDDREYTIYRFTLDRCTFINGVLSDNKFHADHAAWWAKPEAERNARPQDTTYLKNIADFIGMEVEELAEHFCSEDALKRAMAYRAVGDYHGFDNLDSYPLTMKLWEVKARYKELRFKAPAEIM